MARQALIAVGAGLTSALASLAFIAGAPFALTLVYLAPLPMMMAGLALGFRATVFGSLAGFMTIGMFGGMTSAAIFGLVHALPALMVVNLALMKREPPEGGTVWFPPGPIAAMLAVLGAGFLVSAALMVASGPGLQGLITAHLGEAFTMMAPNMPEESRRQVAGMLAPLFPGAVSASWVIMAVINATLAQGLVVRMGHNLRPSPAYAAFDLPMWLSWPLVGAAAVALAGSGEWEYAGRNVAMILAVPYFLLGLAVVHTLARRVAFTGPLLVAFYLVIVVSLWAALVVAGIGVVEQWIGLRGRNAPPPSPHGGGGTT